MGDMTEHFSRKEFACPCRCGKANIDPHLVHILQGIRWMLEKKFGKGPRGRIVISSGVRCVKYNDQIGGSKESAHIQFDNESFGYAADPVMVDSQYASYFVKLANAFGIERMGFGMKISETTGNKTIHCHIDTHPTLPQPRMWGY